MYACHTFASTSQLPLSRKHIRFKPTPSFAIAKPTTSDFAFSPTLAMANCGIVLAADPLVATLVTSFSTKSGVIPQDDLTLLSRLQDFWSPGMPWPSHIWSAQLSGGRPLFTAACWHTNNQSNTTTVRQHIPKKHILKKPILPTSTIKMKGGGDVLQGHHIRGRAISCNAFIILHSQRRNWYLYHNITTELLWKKHDISMKMIPFGACHPFLVNHHNILIGKGG
jgi:hypothetical protein